jgi:hypothetical protein
MDVERMKLDDAFSHCRAGHAVTATGKADLFVVIMLKRM